MRRNQALAKQRAGKVTLGPVLVYDSPDAAEQVAHLGFDWVWLDWQHGQFTESTLNNALGRFLAVETTPLVRVRYNEPGAINRVLDMGAMGVIVPMVQNAAEAAAAVKAAYYPPKGLRSGGGVRLALIGGDSGYYAHANDEIMMVVMVETEEAIANVKSIMEVPGVDVVLIGPGDLMINVKANGHDEAYHEELSLQVVEASRQTGTVAGYVCVTHEQAAKRVAQGFKFINYGSDHAAVTSGMKQLKAEYAAW